MLAKNELDIQCNVNLINIICAGISTIKYLISIICALMLLLQYRIHAATCRKYHRNAFRVIGAEKQQTYS